MRTRAFKQLLAAFRQVQHAQVFAGFAVAFAQGFSAAMAE